ncbi:hypothetical protein DUHN55_37740 [Helicobacter pylori]|uniref:YtxH domain-containing protein n=1 Tax=unclassified Janibacter TaxID=2649294 RepID=UPI0020CC29E4|nr:YtxH domain-containing protein [Janibacter sp. CX7]UTT67512.1 YtxH domain-containing protein [Janibacter sp. CX7]
MGKISMLAAGAIGYVFGTRAGREQYDKISGQAKRLWKDPKVQRKAGQAQEAAEDLGHKAGDKITAKVKEKAGNDSTDTPTTTTTASPGTGVGTTPGTGAGGLGSGEPTSGPGTTPGRGGLG